MSFWEQLCSCFGPTLQEHIIGYLNSSRLNSQVLEEEKCSEEIREPKQSIYQQAKTKAYYFQIKQEEEHPQEEENKTEIDPHFYPELTNLSVSSIADQLYQNKLAALQRILRSEPGEEWSKVFDSQNEQELQIYCKQEAVGLRRFHSYYFKCAFKEPSLTPKDYLKLANEGHFQSLLKDRKTLNRTAQGVELCHRTYNKILVVKPHEFYTGEKRELISQDGKEYAYDTVFSVRDQTPKIGEFSRGWINLCGLRLAHKGQNCGVDIKGYVNVELEISVSTSMLKQPASKQLRNYVQRLQCLLTQSDAI